MTKIQCSLDEKRIKRAAAREPRNKGGGTEVGPVKGKLKPTGEKGQRLTPRKGNSSQSDTVCLNYL